MKKASTLCCGGLAAFLLAAASPAAAATVHVNVKSLGFSPATMTAHVGDTLEWDNTDFIDHTATATDKSWDVKIPAHGKGSVVLKKAGDIHYFCTFHPMMKGEVNVRP